jgi:hypothetical protein
MDMPTTEQLMEMLRQRVGDLYSTNNILTSILINHPGYMSARLASEKIREVLQHISTLQQCWGKMRIEKISHIKEVTRRLQDLNGGEAR